MSFSLQYLESPEGSILASIGSLIAPVFAPLGLNDWRVVTSLISGFLAKESVVSILSVLFGSTEIMLASFTIPAVSALLVFCLLYTPCVAAVAAVRREQGHKGAISMVVFQCLVAWIMAFLIKLLLSLFI